MKVKEWFKRFLAGIGIGVGAAIPGVSGAAVAVIFKVYESLIWAINNIIKKFVRSMAIILPILLGVICAVIPCIWLFDKALETFVFGTLCIFAGFLIGSFPGVTDEVKGVKPNKKYITLMVAGAIFVLILGALSVLLGDKINLNTRFDEMTWYMYLILIPVGFIAAVALTIPGMSGSLILLIIGFYKPLLSHTVDWAKEALVNGNWNNAGKLVGMLGCFALGVLIGVIVVSKIMKWLLANHRKGTYFTIIGFVAGSILVLFFNYEIFNYYRVWAGQTIIGYNPALPIYLEMPIGFALLIGCAILSYQLVRLSRKNKKEEKVE